MAKVCMIQREIKREKLVNKYAARRAELKAAISAPDTAPEERFAAMLEMSKLPADSSKTRQTTRCDITGRPKGYYRKFGLGRNKLRQHVMNGDVPGMVKASW